MTSTNQRDTVSSSIREVAGEVRVSFEHPADGYTLAELDALEVAIQAARKQLDLPEQSTPSLTYEQLYGRQLEQMVPVPT